MAYPTFLHDLLQAQHDWNCTYAELAARQGCNTALRRRLLRLSTRLFWHPFWTTGAGRWPAARLELQSRVRRQETDGHEW